MNGMNGPPRTKARKHTGGMVVVKQLAAEFQIQLAAEALYTLAYVLRLQLKIFFVIESLFVHGYTLFMVLLG